jgi:acyl-CoA thioester hydrolase
MGRFSHRFFIRFADIDQQGVVFNAHYLTYCDTAIDHWLRDKGWAYEAGVSDWDFMLVKAVLEWKSSARYADELDVEVHASRWGTKSFDVVCEGSVGDRPIFAATLTYVGVKHGTTETVAVPQDFKVTFAEATEAL